MDKDEKAKPECMSRIELLPKCPVCGVKFTTARTMVGHLKSHNQEDDEYDKSVVAENDRNTRELF